MSRRVRSMLAILIGLALIVAACSNSGDDDAGTELEASDDTTADDSATDDSAADDSAAGADDTAADDTAADDTGDDDTGDDAPDRDTFVSLAGVPGVTDTEITVGVIGLRSGNPLGTCILDCYVTGIEAYFDYQNSLGGIFGRQLVVGEVLDDALLQNQPRALELIANEDSFAAFGATLNPTGYPDLQGARVPTIVWGIQAPALADNDALFGHLATSCGTCTGRGTPYQVQLAGATKVATLGYGISPESMTCANTTAESVTRYASDIGAEVVYVNDNLSFGLDGGIAPQVSEMIGLGVDYVASCLDLNAMKTMAQEFDRQGYRDQVTLQHPNTYDAGFVAEAGSLFDGDFVSPQFVPFEFEGVPALDTYFEWVDAHGGQVAEQTMIGWIGATLLVDGLIATGPEFNREALISTINTQFTSHSAGGLINPIDWTRQHSPPTDGDRVSNGFVNECIALVQMQGGEFQTITEEPFLCWSNSTTDWGEPTPTSFD